MTADDFRSALARLRLSQSAFARLLARYGDQAEATTILRRVQRWATAEAKVSGEAIAFITLYEHGRSND